MGPDLLDPARCPGCSAVVRPSSPWCTQCFLALAPLALELPLDAAVIEDAAVPADAPVPADAAVRVDVPVQRPAPAAPPSAGREDVTWPCAGCATANPLDLDACAGCGAPFLPPAEPVRLVLPVVGDVVALSRGRRAAVAGAVGLLLALFVLLLALLLG